MRRSDWLFVAVVLALFATLAVRGEWLRLPEVRAPAAGSFDTARAMARLGRILGDQRPHPADSAANDAVRARLIAELQAIGINPRVTDSITCEGPKQERIASCARVRNVVATVGPADGKHLLLVSHYDSTPVGPGASDDGIGMAAMLETAALLQGRVLKRPVTFLFNEGEEVALLGARAFLDHDPVAPRVDTLLNFESRGVNGPALMFESSQPNGPAVGYLQRAVARPVANSMATDFYRLIPNSTDVAVFDQRQWTILNFAVIGNETRYHSAGDRLEALDPKSLQHMGDQALALALDIGGGGAPGAGRKVTFTDVIGRGLVVVPALAALVGLGFLLLACAAIALRRDRAPVGRAVLLILAAMVASAVLVLLVQGAVKLARPGDYWRAMPIFTDLALYASALLVCTAVLIRFARELDSRTLRRAYWLVFIAIGTALSAFLSGAAILFLLPGAVAAIGLLVGRREFWAERVGTIGGAILLYLLWTPLLWLMGLLLDHGSVWIFAPVVALIALPWLIEAKGLVSKAALVPVAALAVVAWSVAALATAYSQDRNQEFGIEYLWDAAKGEGQWLLVTDGAPLPAALSSAKFEGGLKVPWSTRPRWITPAPPRLAPVPAIEMLSQRQVQEGRIVSIRLRMNGAKWLMLRAPPAAKLIAAGAGGSIHRIGGPEKDEALKGDSRDDSVFRCQGRSCDGLQVDLLIGNSTPQAWTVFGFRSGLPDAGRFIAKARPADAAAQYTPDSTIGSAKIRL